MEEFWKTGQNPTNQKKPPKSPNLQTSTSHRQTNNNPHPCLLGFFSLISVEWKTRFCSFWICQVCSVFNCAYICEFRVYLSKNDFCRSLYRCVVLSDPLKDSSRSQESWNAFLTKLRTLLLMSFTKNLGKFEDDMRTLREKRTEPGWSFCEYFMVQVRVSFYWRKYLSSSFDNGCFLIVVGFLVLSVFWSFLESWGRKYEDWYKSSIFTSLDLYGARCMLCCNTMLLQKQKFFKLLRVLWTCTKANKLHLENVLVVALEFWVNVSSLYMCKDTQTCHWYLIWMLLWFLHLDYYLCV